MPAPACGKTVERSNYDSKLKLPTRTNKAGHGPSALATPSELDPMNLQELLAKLDTPIVIRPTRRMTQGELETYLDKAADCPRRSQFDPPCRSQLDPGMGAGVVAAGCG